MEKSKLVQTTAWHYSFSYIVIEYRTFYPLNNLRSLIALVQADYAGGVPAIPGLVR